VFQSTHARFDLGRIVEGFRRAGGDAVAAIAEQVDGGSASVTAEEWARCWRLFGPWVLGARVRDERGEGELRGRLRRWGGWRRLHGKLVNEH
jgi:hypothetical protein